MGAWGTECPLASVYFYARPPVQRGCQFRTRTENRGGTAFFGTACKRKTCFTKVKWKWLREPRSHTQDALKLALTSPEVAVSRHLTRNGDSRYLINQNPCRLRDISELFMDTGIGVDAYSVMEQSKIDLILNVRPEERRFLFDEVAGITKYKHRKKTALRKLEQTEQNLARINDVIQELQRETESLREQAEQARLYNTQQAQLKQFELELAHREYDKLRIDYNQAQTDLDEVLTTVASASETLKTAEEGIENATNRRSELDETIREGQTALREVEAQIEHIERQIVLHKERQLNIQRQRERALQTLESLKAQRTGIVTQQRERTPRTSETRGILQDRRESIGGASAASHRTRGAYQWGKGFRPRDTTDLARDHNGIVRTRTRTLSD